MAIRRNKCSCHGWAIVIALWFGTIIICGPRSPNGRLSGCQVHSLPSSTIEAGQPERNDSSISSLDNQVEHSDHGAGGVGSVSIPKHIQWEWQNLKCLEGSWQHN